ncbi:retrovirus-related Pol polyprotein from transposon 297 [Trichonephila clavipes]|nr:retrovirus-related Pol polyprotein from transposon 297 [Trichonephila clavipes]
MQYQCMLEVDFMRATKTSVDFDKETLVILTSEIKGVPQIEDLTFSHTKVDDSQLQELQTLLRSFRGLFSDKLGLTHVLYHAIHTDDNPPVVSRPYRYDRVKKKIIDYHVNKMLEEGTIISIQSPYTSPVVLCRKNNSLSPESPEVYHFTIDNQKLDAITKYPRYPLPLIEDLITNVPHNRIMSLLDLRTGYFQLGVNPRNIPKTAFVMKSGTYTHKKMPFGIS